MNHTTLMKGKPLGFTKLGFSGQKMKYPLNALFGMVVGEQNTGKSYLFQSNPDAFIINLDLSSTVTPECAATIWPGVNEDGLPIDIDGKHLVLTWDKVLEKKKQLIDMAQANEPRPKCVVLDTITPCVRLLKPYIAKKMDRTSFEQAHGPAAYDKLFDEILSFAFDLRQVGYGVWFIAHLSREFLQVSDDGAKQEELTLNLSSGMVRRLTPAVEMIAPVCCDRRSTTVMETKVVKSGAKQIERKIPTEKIVYDRKLAFDDPRFSRIIRTRTTSRLPNIPLDPVDPWGAFESAFNDANKES